MNVVLNVLMCVLCIVVLAVGIFCAVTGIVAGVSGSTFVEVLQHWGIVADAVEETIPETAGLIGIS